MWKVLGGVKQGYLLWRLDGWGGVSPLEAGGAGVSRGLDEKIFLLNSGQAPD
jgi:hypothetical protein